jgi:hypothetical protein
MIFRAQYSYLTSTARTTPLGQRPQQGYIRRIGTRQQMTAATAVIAAATAKAA